ncbi:MAG: signal peptidase I [Deinococcota bacterium]|nr:signal peptidase I [Deinococcota bacterium]
MTTGNPAPPPSEQPSWLAKFLSYLIAFALGIFVVTFLFTTVGISGDSMQPSLHDGERVFVPKYEYWLRQVGLGHYERGEIIFFRPPLSVAEPRLRLPILGLDLPSFYIKRVVGLPGERVAIRRGVIYIDGRPLAEDYLRGLGYSSNESMPELRVPADAYFVVGDNRHPYGSLDSRRFGPIAEDAIAGRVNFVLWPPLRRGEGGVWQLNLRSLAASGASR